MQIFVTRVSGGSQAGRQLTLEVESEWTVDQLKAHIEEHHGIAQATQLLTFNAVKLLSGTRLRDYQIHREAGLQLAERPVGARRHADQQGSLDKEISDICGAGDGLRCRWERLGAAKAQLAERKEALKHLNSGGELKKKVKINVGGSLFQVSRKVLCDAVPESHLAQLFSGRWESKILRDSDGVLFLDDPPECFSAIVTFLKARLKDKTHAEVPAVTEEWVPCLHRLLDHFGLGHLFAPPAGDDRPAAAGGDQMEPEPEAEGEAGAEAEEGVPPPAVVEEKVHLAAETEQVELPANTIDHIIKARYGKLQDPGKWVDVTRMLSDMVDEEGGLSVQVSSSGFGVDPAPDAEKQLSIQYKPCEAWESERFEDRLKRLQAAADAERAALRRAVKQQRDLELDFEDELEWVKHYIKPEDRAAPASEVVELVLSTGGRRDRVCVRRSTLMLCADSALARKFDPRAAVAPAGGVAGGGGGDDSDDSDDDDDDDDDDDATTIEEDAHRSFGRLLNQLRLIAIASPGDPPPPPIIRPHEEAGFATLLATYFEGNEDFVKTSGEHRPAGSNIRGFNLNATGSEIMSQQQSKVLLGFLPQGRPQLELLYRATRDGWGSADFHRLCDSQGATVTVVKSAGGFIFGGYADLPWGGGSAYKASPGAFLFGLHTSKGQGPIKLTQGGQSPNAGRAVHHNSSTGPRWGGGHDLQIGDNPNAANSSYASLGHTYNPPPGGVYGQPSANEYFAEAYQFTLAEFEVFRVQ